MGYGYQKRDFEIADYQLWEIDGIKHPFRGPKPVSREKESYFACLGAAQTFGCFCEKPFPTLLGEKLNFNVLNIGHAGAGPLFFLLNNKDIRLVNAAKFVIVQVMSGRSESNSVFEAKQGCGKLERKSDGVEMMAVKAYHEFILKSNKRQIIEIIAETRENYVNHFIELLNLIRVPKVLFWFSERTPDYTESYEDARKLFGKYPHLVNRQMVEQLKP